MDDEIGGKEHPKVMHGVEKVGRENFFSHYTRIQHYPIKLIVWKFKIVKTKFPSQIQQFWF